MNPFDQPPTEPPVSLDPPSDTPVGRDGGRHGHDGPRRGRMAIAAVAAVGLVGGGIVVAGQFASADRPTLDAAETVDEPAPEAPVDETDDVTDDQPDGEAPGGGVAGLPSIDGEIVIDDGDGDPFVLDLGRLSECLAPVLGDGPTGEWDFEWHLDQDGDGMPLLPFDPERFGEELFGEDFEQRIEEFLDGLPLDELDGDLEGLDDGVRIFGSGGSTVTVVGPDGVEVIDLGDGDATVTIEQSDGELTIETDGDATVSELPDIGRLLPELGDLDLGDLDLGDLDLGDLDLGELDLGELDLGELGELDLEEWSDRLPFDLEGIESCLDDLGDGER